MQVKTFRKGQGTLEYAIIIMVVIGALIVLQWYIRGAMQGRYKSSSDDIGEQFSQKAPSQFNTTISSDSTQKDTPTLINDTYGASSKVDTQTDQNRLGSFTYNHTQFEPH